MLKADDPEGDPDGAFRLRSVQAGKCATGASFGFGCTSEEKIDEWIRRNRKYSYADPEQAEEKAGKTRPG